MFKKQKPRRSRQDILTSIDQHPSPVPIHEVPTQDPNLKIQQLVVGKDREGHPYVLSIKSHRETGEIVVWLGQSLIATGDGQVQ